ncbi:hypothetical protein J6590_098639 [Homalodisca vitripennis]|nr:hypothetical protein J6590_098639 [Homalodisca vitripennis]
MGSTLRAVQGNVWVSTAPPKPYLHQRSQMYESAQHHLSRLQPGPSNKGCTILPAGVTPWSSDRIRHEPDVCRVYPLATMGA